jgi:hypothetical protein
MVAGVLRGLRVFAQTRRNTMSLQAAMKTMGVVGVPEVQFLEAGV